MKSNLNYKNPKKNIRPKRPLTSKNIHKKSPNILASEESKRIYQTQGTYPNSKFLKQLNTDKLELYLNNLNPADIAVISKILPKYTYFQQLILGAFEPRTTQTPIQRSNYYSKKNRNSKSLGKPAKKSNNIIKESDRALFKQKIFTATEKNLIISKNILSLSLLSFKIDLKLSKILSKGILDNKSLQYLSINNSILSVESFEILLKGVLTHEILRFLDLSNNKLNDNYSPMIARIIQRQAQRRDQIIWSYQLRNELPSDNNYKIGLISLNLHGNYFGPKTAKLISDSLNNDQYIRYIDLSKNIFDNFSCKLFVHMMRKNSTLLTVDLRDNSGYDEFINPRIVMKMSKNIKILYSQYQNGEYTEEEFEYLKGFIDISFFDVDIPQEIVQYYNNNLQQAADNRSNNNIMQSNNIENNQIIDNPKKINNNSDEYNNNEINNNEMEQEQEQEIENIKFNNEINNKNNINKLNNQKINEIEYNNKAYQKNQNLIEENLKLKQEILELKAQSLQNNFSKERQSEEEKDLENYYNRANEIIETLNEVMAKLQQHKDKNNNNININEINSLIEDKKKEIKNEENGFINKQNNNNKKDDINSNKNTTNLNNNDINNSKNKKNIIIKEKKVDELKNNNENENINNQIKINNIVNKKDNNNENIQLNKKQKEESDLKNNNENKINSIAEKKEMKKNEISLKEEKKELKEEIPDKKELNNSEEEDEDDFNLDNLTEEEKMALMQQREILMKLQEEAEARGEHFDIQEYLAQLAEQSEEDDDFGKQENKSNKLNKSF